MKLDTESKKNKTRQETCLSSHSYQASYAKFCQFVTRDKKKLTTVKAALFFFMKNMPEKQTGDKRDLGLAAPVAFSLSWLSSNGRFMVMQNSSLLKALFYDGLSK